MNHITPKRMPAILQTFALSIALLVPLSGCSVKIISSYDEKTDNSVTQLQKDFETFFVTVENQAGLPECKYKNHTKFYQDSKVAVSGIEVRAQSIPKNEITVEQVALLKDSLGKLEQLHKISCLTPRQVENLRSSFNTSITAILKLELAKKLGE